MEMGNINMIGLLGVKHAYLTAIKTKLNTQMTWWNLRGKPGRQKPEYAEGSEFGLAQFKAGDKYDPEPFASAALQVPQLDGALDSYTKHIAFLSDPDRTVDKLFKAFLLEKESYSDKHCADFLINNLVTEFNEIKGAYRFEREVGELECNEGVSYPKKYAIELQRNKNDDLVITKVELDNLFFSNKDEPKHWLLGKMQIMGIMSLDRLITGHVAEGHFDGDRYALAVLRQLSLNSNPVSILLDPYLKGSYNVSGLGGKVIWAENGVAEMTGSLTNPSIVKMAVDVAKTYNWKTWKKTKNLGRGHHYANGEEIFYDCVVNYVNDWFDTHSLTPEDKQEIKAMSEELMHWSPELNGKKVLSPVWSEDEKELNSNIRTLCIYIIHKLTYVHSSYHLGENESYNSRFRVTDDYEDYMKQYHSQESLDYRGVMCRIFSYLKYLSYSSYRNEYPSLTKVTAESVKPLIALLEARRDDFVDNNINIDMIYGHIY